MKVGRECQCTVSSGCPTGVDWVGSLGLGRDTASKKLWTGPLSDEETTEDSVELQTRST